MRWSTYVAIALGVAAANPAAAQSFTPSSERDLAARDFTPNAADILNRAAFAQDAEVRLTPLDTLRIRREAVPADIERAGLTDGRVDVMAVRTWPGAISFSSKKLEIDVAPHAGFGVSRFGTQAEGGATLTVSKSRGEQAMERLRDMGVKDGAGFGDTGRWYLFAAASGRAVGLNMLRGENGWDRAGWTTDTTGALVGDAQVGVGWRKGEVQSSFGVIHREVKGKHMVFGQQTRDDTVAAFTFSFRPQR
ncbi:MAG: lipid A-modifier LpxR family protein [Pseudomonadota bacterium]